MWTSFLGVFTKGSYLAEGVKFNDFDYDIRHAYLASSLKGGTAIYYIIQFQTLSLYLVRRLSLCGLL